MVLITQGERQITKLRRKRRKKKESTVYPEKVVLYSSTMEIQWHSTDFLCLPVYHPLSHPLLPICVTGNFA